ncbi:hypothetical protein CEP51_000115 [Fusarium floridanum]|nr:hypothetical protein CEP51_000115 [Fusarium floridanum]
MTAFGDRFWNLRQLETPSRSVPSPFSRMRYQPSGSFPSYMSLHDDINFEGEPRTLEPTGSNDHLELNGGGSSIGNWDELLEYPEIGPELWDDNGNSGTNFTEDEEDGPKHAKSPSMSMNLETSLRKRPRHGSEDDDKEHSDGPVTKRQRSNEDASQSSGSGIRLKAELEDTSPRSFACPFYRSSPAYFQKCSILTLTSISRVKQHIIRAHTKPSYCPVCYRTFTSLDARDEHLIERACQIGEHVVPEGITRSQEAMLRSRSGTKNMSDRDHWYRIWNILFEEAPKTKSIYLGDWQSEVIEASRQFMNQEGVAIIIRQLGRDDARWKNDEELKTRLEKALSKVFDEWESFPTSARKLKNSGRSGGPEETSQQRAPEEGEVGPGTESESFEGTTSSGTRKSKTRRSQMGAPHDEQK